MKLSYIKIYKYYALSQRNSIIMNFFHTSGQRFADCFVTDHIEIQRSLFWCEIMDRIIPVEIKIAHTCTTKIIHQAKYPCFWPYHIYFNEI